MSGARVDEDPGNRDPRGVVIIVTAVADGSATAEVGPDRIRPVIPELEYQGKPWKPKVTGRIAGVEALGRLRQSDGQLLSVGPLFADPKTPATALRQLDREIRGDALRRLHEAPGDWFMSLNISPRWVNRLRPQQPLPSLKQLQQLLVATSCWLMHVMTSSTTPDYQRIPCSLVRRVVSLGHQNQFATTAIIKRPILISHSRNGFTESTAASCCHLV